MHPTLFFLRQVVLKWRYAMESCYSVGGKFATAIPGRLEIEVGEQR